MSQSIVDMPMYRTRACSSMFICVVGLLLCSTACGSRNVRLRRETSSNRGRAASEPQNSQNQQVEYVEQPTSVTAFENGDCVFRCKVKNKTPLMEVKWIRNSEDSPITRNRHSFDEVLYTVVGDVKGEFNLKVRNVSQRDNGSTFACLVYNSTDPGSQTKLLNMTMASLKVIKAPGNKYPKCSGKPMNTHSKTFSLSCCTEKMNGVKLEWKFSAGNRIPDHKAAISSGGKGQFCVHHNLTSVHNGASYTCHLSAVGNVQGLNRTCKIQYQKPEVRLEQMDSQQAKFRCSATGAETYNWNLGDESNNSQYALEKGSSVMILNLNTVHNGTFITCTAIGKESMGSDGIMLIMGRPSSKEQSMTLILGVVMGTIAGLLAIILIIYLIKMNALQKCCGENEFPSLEFRTIIRMRGSQNASNGPSSYYVVQSTSAGTSSMHPLMAERDSSNSRLSTSGYQSDSDSLQAVGAVGGAVGGSNFAGNYYELRKPPRPGGPIRGATCRDYYNDPGLPPPRPPKPGLTDPRKLNVEGLDYADLDLVDVAEEEDDIPMKLPEEQTEYADILRIPSLRHSSIS